MTTEQETWVRVADFPAYEVSSLGNVRSSYRDTRIIGKYLKPWLAGIGYPTVALYRDGKQYKRYVHELVCVAFHGSRPTEYHQVAHAPDDDKQNNREDNLRWATPTENAADRIDAGTALRGEGVHFATTSAEVVKQIDSYLKAGMPQTQIAERVGVSGRVVHQIKNGYSWVWLTGRTRCLGAINAKAVTRKHPAAFPANP